jgi:endonuclease/exonuclease/phosphatase family metal-dependent hydrolase
MMSSSNKVVIIFFNIIICLIILWIVFQKSLKKVYRPSKEAYSTQTSCDVSFITYNIQKFPFPFKSFDLIKDLLNQYSIVLLQECFDELFSSLESYFPNHYICRGTLDGINVINSGLAILSIYPILETSFSCFKNVNSLTFDVLSEKGYLAAVIDIPRRRNKKNTFTFEESTERIMVIDTHLQSCDFSPYDPVAMLQLEEIAAFTDTVTYPYVIGGDFNIDINVCKKQYPMLDLHYPKDSTIYINFKNAHSKTKASMGYEGLIFDYFIKSHNFRRTVKDVHTITDSTYSDHNPVVMTL